MGWRRRPIHHWAPVPSALQELGEARPRVPCPPDSEVQPVRPAPGGCEKGYGSEPPGGLRPDETRLLDAARGYLGGGCGGHHTGPRGRGQRPQLHGSEDTGGSAGAAAGQGRHLSLALSLGPSAQPSAGPSTKALWERGPLCLGSSCPFTGVTHRAGARLAADDGLDLPGTRSTAHAAPPGSQMNPVKALQALHPRGHPSLPIARRPCPPGVSVPHWP